MKEILLLGEVKTEDLVVNDLFKRNNFKILRANKADKVEKLLREQGRRMPREMKSSLLEIGQRCASLPDKDTRSPDEILGYNSKGLPH